MVEFLYLSYASGSPSGGPDFKNLDKWVLVMIGRAMVINTLQNMFVKLFKSLAPGRATGGH